jgi:3-isopropylmalate/(R)-2-methylmalate dehydratase small subunit
MQNFTILTGIAAPLPDADIDTDIIFPARFLLLLDREGLGQHLFHERRNAPSAARDFVLSRPPFDHAKILVAGRNFGCGSSREHAVWALADFGIRCVIAPSFGEIFYSNCFRNGVLPVVLPPDEHHDVMAAATTGSPFTVDLQSKAIQLPEGKTIAFNIDAHRQRALLLGLDEIGAILADDGADISSFERRQKARSPWLYLDDDMLATGDARRR